MKKNRVKKFIIVLMAITLFTPTVFASNWDADNILGNWETTVYIDGKQMITRVTLDTDHEVTIKLREFIEYLGYSVKWNNGDRSIELINDNEKIKIIVNDTKCEKNGEIIHLSKPVYIDDDYSYLPQSFLFDVLNIETVYVDKAEENNRVNGVYLVSETEAENGNFAMVLFDDPIITTDLISEDEISRKIRFSFILVVQAKENEIDVDCMDFFGNNQYAIKNVIYESLRDMKYETIINEGFIYDLGCDFGNKMVSEINNIIDIQVIAKYFYITGLTIMT